MSYATKANEAIRRAEELPYVTGFYVILVKAIVFALLDISDSIAGLRP